MARDYQDEYKKFHSSEKSIGDRSSRNKARRKAVKNGKAKKGDGRDVHHLDGNPRNNKSSNLKSVPKSRNRSRK